MTPREVYYPPEIILQCVRWYVSYGISYRDLEEMMSERCIDMDHATLNRWVLKYAPEIEKKSRRYKRQVHRSWRLDETYIKVKGAWKYLYRAVDKFGDNPPVDILVLSQSLLKLVKGHSYIPPIIFQLCLALQRLNLDSFIGGGTQ